MTSRAYTRHTNGILTSGRPLAYYGGMRVAADKRASTIRFSAEAKSTLSNIARITQRSESQVAEDALLEYAKNHGFNTRYVMTSGPTCYVLIKQEGDHFFVVDQQVRNGVPLDKIRENYAAKYNSPVELFVEKES